MTKLLRHLAAAVALLSGTAVPLAAVAQAADTERALAISHKDPKLLWGGCPPFLPKGCGLAILRGDPTKENADVFFKLPPGSTLPHHWHTSVERMVLVSGRLHITYDGQAPVVLTPGMYAYGPAKLAHKGRCAKGDPCVLFIAAAARRIHGSCRPLQAMNPRSRNKASTAAEASAKPSGSYLILLV